MTGTMITATVAGPLLVADLLRGPETLSRWLRAAVADRQWLDAYLLAAGLTQLVEDRLHPDPLQLRRIAAYLHGPPAWLAGLAASVAGFRIRRRLVHARDALAAVTNWLADRVLGRPAVSAPPTWPTELPELAGEIVRIPACFRDFDQHPDDLRWLAAAYLREHPDREAPTGVVGVRTSGSYLAPLLAAALRAAGVTEVVQLSYRPGRPLLFWERSRLRGVQRVLVIDDPPGTGTSLAATARAVERTGASVVLALPLFAGIDEPPPALRHWPAVVQRWDDWTVHQRLRPEAVRDRLAELVAPDRTVVEVRALGAPSIADPRGHIRGRFAVRFGDRHGLEADGEVVVEGAGLGYLGRQSIAIAEALADHLPAIYGFADGLLFRESPRGTPGASAETVAAYVADRADRLASQQDPVRRLRGREPVWEVAARLLAGQFGRFAPMARPLLLEPLVRRLLTGYRPSVVDGRTDHRRWISGTKVDFFQRSFSHLDLACYDSVFDLAGAAADPPSIWFERALRTAFHQITGQLVDGERWLLYRLAQLWRMGRAGDLPADQVRRCSASAVHDYLAEHYLADLPATSGPLCAIDLDGVLECDALGYPATSPTGMLALRALIAHGYRPVPVTGRSVADVRDRCDAFGLLGGVAEYGTALYLDGAEVDLRPPSAQLALELVRQQLAARPGVRLDPAYRHAVRASTLSGPLPAPMLAQLPALADPAIRTVHGAGQTDITVAGLDKGTGLRALATRLSTSNCALAVGDTAEDLPMLARAAVALAPRNATVTGVPRVRHAYQLGLADACATLLGHHPGGCPTCRPPMFSLRTLALLTVLDLRASGTASLPGGTASLAITLASRRW